MKALTGLPAEAYLKVSEEAKIQLANLLQLVQALEKGAAPAYLARYRPDVCGGLDERAIRDVHAHLKGCLELADRKVSILAAVERRGMLTPELRQRLERTMDRRGLEDLYLPYRPKKRDSADEAFERGLEPLARLLWDQNRALDIDAEVVKFVNADKGVADAAAALDGAYAIAARWLSEKPEIRRELRKLFLRDGEIVVSAAPGKKAAKQRHLIGYRSKASKISWSQMLAIRRAACDGVLNYALDVPAKAAEDYLGACLLTDKESPYAPHIARIAETAVKSRTLAGLREDVLQSVEDRSDAQAVRSFQKSLRKTLLAPPARGLTIAGLEIGRPGGWRAAVVNPEGEVVGCAVVHTEKAAPGAAENGGGKLGRQAPPAAEPAASDAPETAPRQADSKQEEAAPENAAPRTAEDAAAQAEAAEPVPSAPPEDANAAAVEAASAAGDAGAAETEQSAAPAAASVAEPPPAAPKQVRREATPEASLAELLAEHKVDLVVFPNGPGLRRVERFLRAQIRQSRRTQIVWQAVNSAGAWIYANSKSAKRDMPQYEPAVRSAACLARRVQDPLSELVKVDPKTLGIGPGHHEVEPKRLREALQATVEECVHEVGVDLNRAPQELLALVPGLTERLAKRIVEYRAANGPLAFREDCRKAQGLNDRIYRQAAGFLRVRGENPLDDTGVHPALYPLVERLVSAVESDIETVLSDPAALEKLNLGEFAGQDHPLPRLQALVRELHPQRRNVRGEFQMPKPGVELRTNDDLQVGAKVEGTVSTVTAFGAFIDIGGDHDGLLHVSQMADELVKESKPEIKTGDRVPVFITGLEQNGSRISLSMREPRPERKRQRAAAERARGAASNGAPRRSRAPRRQASNGKKAAGRQFGPNEKELAREARRIGSMSMADKLLLLKDKYRTKT